MKRIGILGGTFDPVHIGHLTIAQMVHEQLKLDKVIFIPSNLPPHKNNKVVVSANDRCHMLRLAIKGNSHFDISDFEIKKKGKSFSIDSVRYLRDCYPRGTKLFFIIGSDLIATLHTWKCIDEILKIVTFVAVNRPGYAGKKSKIKVKSITTAGLEISSIYVRRCIRAGKTVKYLVPENALKYINQKKLYRK